MIASKWRFLTLESLQTSTKWVRSMSVLSKSIKYSKYGEPGNVLHVVEEELAEPKGNQVLVKILAAPINPSDVLTVQGIYPVRPKLPAVAGNEFVAEILSVGENVKNLQIGQRVVPNAPAIGTWRTHGIYTEEKLMPISNKIGLLEAATLTVNPCTAYRMLKDFVDLQPGDVVIQNGANSACGEAVHQLCKLWNIESVGVVRNRPDISALKQHLMNLGASEVLTEEELRTTTLFKDKLKKPKLALNCVGGQNAAEIAKHLEDKGVMVTYGSMSHEEVTAGNIAQIFKDISYRGFWITRWSKENAENNKRIEMINDLASMMEQGKFKVPVHELVPLSKFKEAASANGFAGRKFILDLQSN